MRETRNLRINKRVFSKADINKLAQFLWNESQQPTRSRIEFEMRFKINCDDGTSYASKSIDIFNDDGIIDTKRTESIEMALRDYDLDQYITISIVKNGYRDDLTVEGDDQYWVNGCFNRLTEIINAVKPQVDWPYKYRRILFHIIALGVGSIIYFLYWALILRHLQPIANPGEILKQLRSFARNNLWFSYVLQWISAYGFGIGWAFSLRERLLSLWPNIEFDFGPEHFNLEKKRRRHLSAIATLVVLPLAISVVYDITKIFFTK